MAKHRVTTVLCRDNPKVLAEDYLELSAFVERLKAKRQRGPQPSDAVRAAERLLDEGA